MIKFVQLLRDHSKVFVIFVKELVHKSLEFCRFSLMAIMSVFGESVQTAVGNVLIDVKRMFERTDMVLKLTIIKCGD